MPIAPIVTASATIAPNPSPTFCPKVHERLMPSLLLLSHADDAPPDRIEHRPDIDHGADLRLRADELAHVRPAREVIADGDAAPREAGGPVEPIHCRRPPPPIGPPRGQARG